MNSAEKRYPAFDDASPMPFGKHKDEPLVDVPARYLVWLWNDGLKDDYGRSNQHREGMAEWMEKKALLANYIWNCKEALEQETGELM